jgi:hypothetical protein
MATLLSEKRLTNYTQYIASKQHAVNQYFFVCYRVLTCHSTSLLASLLVCSNGVLVKSIPLPPLTPPFSMYLYTSVTLRRVLKKLCGHPVSSSFAALVDSTLLRPAPLRTYRRYWRDMEH